MASDIATKNESATNSAEESGSKNQSQKAMHYAEESKSMSPDVVEPEQTKNIADDDNSDDEFIEPDNNSGTLAKTRARRARTQRVSYKDESSSEDEESEEDSDDDNPLFAGLDKAERAAMKAKMADLQKSSATAASKEREQSIEEIISSFEFNIGEKVTKEEAGFAFDFCRKHKIDINDKIEEAGFAFDFC